ncbi:protease production regulatory protein Hpr [Desulfocucumis palustris]|uniref:Protease production regulatory protein Hpr n=1 Tax=Desulfocucumis palustris TaxID=1898651 RepID=A0A2L2XCR7_9FIRM|nr:MarR family transcriptional regulator [Desulfocucumis palustris]GBF34038.1 protease production regulatory protein Hpr [Desulfocucumis palustris]
MKDTENRALLHMLLNLFRGLYKSIDDDLREAAAKCGLTTAQQHLLWVLYFNNGSTLTEISELGQWHVSTVMNMVERMEKTGLLYKIVDENDARVKRIFLTPQGEALREKTETMTDNYRLYRILAETDEAELKKEIKPLINLVRRLAGDKFVNYVMESTNYLRDSAGVTANKTN